MTRANEEWRNDLARRQAAADHYDQQRAAVAEALPHLKAAYEAFRSLRTYDHDSYGRLVADIASSVFVALTRARTTMTDGNAAGGETYIGNMAAFGVGWTEGSTP